MDIKCQITGEIMYDPVVASDGFVYEKDAIESWFIYNNCSPITKQPLENKFYPCISVKKQIDKYLTKYPHKKAKQYIPSFEYTENKNIIYDIIRAKNFDKLLKYKNFDVVSMGNFEIFITTCDNIDVIIYVMDNSIYNDTNGKTLLHYACHSGKSDVVKYFLSKIPKDQMDVNLEAQTTDGERPIHYAYKSGNLELIKYLDSLGVEMNCPGIHGKKPLLYTNVSSLIDIYKYHIEKGYDIDCIKGTSLINDIIIELVEKDDVDNLMYLVNIGIKLNTNSNSYWRIPLHNACNHNSIKVVKYLISISDDKTHNIDLEYKCANGSRPIHFACQRGSVELIQCLVEKGVDLESVGCNLCKPIHWVCRNNTFDTIKYIVDQGVDLKAKYNSPYNESIIDLLQWNTKLSVSDNELAKQYIQDKMNNMK